MKTLNLVYPEQSDIKYKISKFPDGQQNITLIGYNDNQILDKKIIWLKGPIQIKSRLNNWLDLELITCTVAALRELDVEEIHLYSPYIVGARSDRKFEEGGNNYLRDVLCPIINSLNLKTVTCIDPHSYVLEGCIKNFRKQSNEELVKFAINDIYDSDSNEADNNMIWVSPDDGASKKIYKLATQIDYKGDIIICSKDRDVSGKLTKTNVPIKFEHVGKDILIVDDIIDGGGTFTNIAKEIKREFEGSATKNKLYLIVTHGIFSKGFDELAKYFDGIYCTNSYSNIRDKYISYTKGETGVGLVENLVKQLNVY